MSPPGQDGPFTCRFTDAWTDCRGRRHPGPASIYFRNRLFASDLHGRDAQKWVRTLNEAFRLGQKEPRRT